MTNSGLTTATSWKRSDPSAGEEKHKEIKCQRMPELNKQASVTSAAPNGSAAPSRSALINGDWGHCFAKKGCTALKKLHLYSTLMCWDWYSHINSYIWSEWIKKLDSLSPQQIFRQCSRDSQGGTYFLRCSCSFRNSSVLLLLTPEPLLYVLKREPEYKSKIQGSYATIFL